MISLGGLFILLGFGSLILPIFNLQFKLLFFVEGMQPWFGIILGIIGIILVVLGVMQNNKQEQPQQSYPPQQGQPPQQ